jgi:hypothetical protein
MTTTYLLTSAIVRYRLNLIVGVAIVLRLRPDIDAMKSFIDVYGGMQCSKRMKKSIEQIRQAFNNGLKPKLTDEGTSGTYEMRDI